MKVRKVIEKVQGFDAQDGAGVKLVRVLGHDNVYNFDPFLMLDSFDSSNPKDYERGFPTHPHRGIETVSFIAKGRMTHRDHLGTKQTIGDGEAQWLTAGSGAFHSEMPAGESLLGLQLWLNLPKDAKMKAAPAYHGITRDEIQEFPLEGGKLRLLTGEYLGHKGWQGKYLPLDYYDIHLESDASVTLDVKKDNTVMIFTLKGDVVSNGTQVKEKTAARLVDGDTVTIQAGAHGAEVMLMSAPPTEEPIAWYGPIVMNTQGELREAVAELNNGTFIKQKTEY
ncbi:MAG: pirin family protein [Bacteroidales bacterium]|nr:pirin family protein [Bacteroidales bacterium]